MQPISYKRHRFPPEVIQQAVWLYFRFRLSLRDVEELKAARGVNVSYETIRRWTIKFGHAIARNLSGANSLASPRWHLDEMVLKIAGRRMYLWRGVDDEGVVLDMLVQRRRNSAAALKPLRRLLKNQGVSPQTIVTNSLRSYKAALSELGLAGQVRRDLNAICLRPPQLRPALHAALLAERDCKGPAAAARQNADIFSAAASKRVRA